MIMAIQSSECSFTGLFGSNIPDDLTTRFIICNLVQQFLQNEVLKNSKFIPNYVCGSQRWKTNISQVFKKWHSMLFLNF